MVFHRWLPKIVSPEKIAIWRDHQDGSWLVRTSENRKTAVSYVRDSYGSAQLASLLQEAKKWKRKLDEMGIGLVLTLVPSPDSDRSLVEAIGSELKVGTILAPRETKTSAAAAHNSSLPPQSKGIVEMNAILLPILKLFS